MNSRTTALVVGATAALAVLALASLLWRSPEQGAPSRSIWFSQDADATRPSATAPDGSAPELHRSQIPTGSFLAERPQLGQPPVVQRSTDADDLVPLPIDDGPYESADAELTAQRIEGNVLAMFDALLTEGGAEEIDVRCATQGRTCRFEGPWLGSEMSSRWMSAVADGRFNRGDLEGIEFEGFRRIMIDGEPRFEVLAHAP